VLGLVLMVLVAVMLVALNNEVRVLKWGHTELVVVEVLVVAVDLTVVVFYVGVVERDPAFGLVAVLLCLLDVSLKRGYTEVVLLLKREYTEVVLLKREHTEVVLLKREHTEVVLLKREHTEVVLLKRDHTEVVLLKREHTEVVEVVAVMVVVAIVVVVAVTAVKVGAVEVVVAAVVSDVV